jgi:hypothetical protein
MRAALLAGALTSTADAAISAEPPKQDTSPPLGVRPKFDTMFM